jgi:DNA-binding LacI/PurR family transcriptional regulator
VSGNAAPPQPNRPVRRQTVVLRDVARAAGVSHQTVSRVLNDFPRVAPETRARVLRVIREMDYRPNITARALSTGQTRTLGVITSDPREYGPANTVHGISEAAEDQGWAVNVVELRTPEPSQIDLTIERLTSQAVEGIITIAPYRAVARALADAPHRIPMLTLDSSFDQHVPAVAVDEVGGSRAAVDYLLELGHSTVWHISGPPGSIAADERIEGWRSALDDAKAVVPPVLTGDWSARSGFELAQQLAARPEVTAVFCANDQTALGAMRALQEAGRRIPHDVSVIGFDDMPEAAYLLPPLTTVRSDFSEVGRRCLSIMLELLSGPSRSWVTSIVPTELVVRGSTGPPARKPVTAPRTRRKSGPT